MTMRDIVIYDTTLRDGSQGEQINFTAEEKMRIARRLDEMGFPYIEGGWPGSNPKDVRFFELAKGVTFQQAKLTAFGSTRRSDLRVEECPISRPLSRRKLPSSQFLERHGICMSRTSWKSPGKRIWP